MVRLGVTKKKKSPRSTDELSQLKDELRRVSEQLESHKRALAEATEQQTATSEILRVISRSPTGLQSVLDRVAERAARLSGSNDAGIFRVEEGMLRRVARFGSLPVSWSIDLIPANRDTVTGRATVERHTIHIHDLQARLDEFPESRRRGAGSGARTVLATPLLREGESIGCITIRRMETQPFSEKQIALLRTFADQVVIAIENVRLFQELQDRNGDLTESLEQQTATSEILRVIASSPADIEPVLNAVAESAARLCEATNAVIYRVDGDVIHPAAVHGVMPPAPKGTPVNRRTPVGRAIVDRQAMHVRDLLAEVDTEYPESKEIQKITGTRTSLSTPLLREGIAIGAIHVRRNEVRPFSENQIALLKTFADQAVIAIENVRLFQELKGRNRDLSEALEQQTATSEILGVIAGSPADIQPVLDVVAESAARLCEASDAQISGYQDSRNTRGCSHLPRHAIAV
jgi:GAF domain-containing protein